MAEEVATPFSWGSGARLLEELEPGKGGEKEAEEKKSTAGAKVGGAPFYLCLS